MVKKKVDSRVRTLLENGIKLNQRSFVVLVGDRGRDQVVNLHYMLSKAQVKTRPSVLWCYKKDLGFSTHRKKRMRQIKKLMKRGMYDPDKENPFDLFVSSTDIRYTYYKDSANILGSTYGMCVLQDFEALTPNLLCRTIETVEGGGVVILLLKTMKSLQQLYTMTMDVHSRFRTEAHQDVVCRFNERFILSLGGCKRCLFMDDELNVLPLSKHAKNIKPIEIESVDDLNAEGALKTESAEQKELATLKQTLADSQLGALVSLARTLDQGKAICQFAEAVVEKTLRSTVALTAARGRGKSAALGISLAVAISHGYSNMFITSPSPENLGTVFEFLFKGLDALGFVDHQDYEVLQSTDPKLEKCVVRVNIFKSHRQTIQYIAPTDYAVLAQAELLVIDEAAAIPLTIVKKLLGPYLVFMSSTVAGYEGTGRALSLKLIKQLREKQSSTSSNGGNGDASGRMLRELKLSEPIRYAPGDFVEKWLNNLLCLDATSAEGQARLTGGIPHPSECELYSVNRDTLFSFHKLSEKFLHRMMSLYVASHYKNTPNDMQLMSDCPSHQLFALLGRVSDAAQNGGVPDVLCVIQVSLEGKIAKASVKAAMARGEHKSGDLIPWTVSSQFQESAFAQLSGARVVRIAVHPDCMGMGYGTRALDQLKRYYQGELYEVPDIDDCNKSEEIAVRKEDTNWMQKKMKPRKKLPPLLLSLRERKPERLHWLGTAFGLTKQLFKFWHRSGLRPVYLRQTSNSLTGEHSIVMISPLDCSGMIAAPKENWLDSFVNDFKSRFVKLLSMSFQKFSAALALSILDFKKKSQRAVLSDTTSSGDIRIGCGDLSANELGAHLQPHDLKRLLAYSRNLVDYHMVMDLMPAIARMVFLRRVDSVAISYIQAAVLLGQGLQHKTIDELEIEMGLPARQLLALFNKCVRKIARHFENMETVAEEGITKGLVNAALISNAESNKKMAPVTQSLHSDLMAGGADAKKVLDEKQKKMLEGMDLMRYAVTGTEEEWAEKLDSGAAKACISGGMLSISKKRKARESEGQDPKQKRSRVKDKMKRSSHKKKKKNGRR